MKSKKQRDNIDPVRKDILLLDAAEELSAHDWTGKYSYPKCVNDSLELKFSKLNELYNNALEREDYRLSDEIAWLQTIYYYLISSGRFFDVVTELKTIDSFERIWRCKLLTTEESLHLLLNRLREENIEKFDITKLINKIEKNEKFVTYQKPAKKKLRSFKLSENLETPKIKKYEIDLKFEYNHIKQGKITKQEAYELINYRLNKSGLTKMNYKSLEKRIERILKDTRKKNTKRINQILQSLQSL